MVEKVMSAPLRTIRYAKGSASPFQSTLNMLAAVEVVS